MEGILTRDLTREEATYGLFSHSCGLEVLPFAFVLITVKQAELSRRGRVKPTSLSTVFQRVSFFPVSV